MSSTPQPPNDWTKYTREHAKRLREQIEDRQVTRIPRKTNPR